MSWRYTQLREAIAILAAPAEDQHAHLERILAPVTGGQSARGYGNDELALDLDGIYSAREDMLLCGEISEAQADAPRELDALLGKWSGMQNADFWLRDALWTDPRWEEVRRLAREALAVFPHEVG